MNMVHLCCGGMLRNISTGGPLGNGDIEDFFGTTVVKCPWHSYRVEVETGNSVEIGLGGQKIIKTHKQSTTPYSYLPVSSMNHCFCIK